MRNERGERKNDKGIEEKRKKRYVKDVKLHRMLTLF
jgi:hypothetical protein